MRAPGAASPRIGAIPYLAAGAAFALMLSAHRTAGPHQWGNRPFEWAPPFGFVGLGATVGWSATRRIGFAR